MTFSGNETKIPVIVGRKLSRNELVVTYHNPKIRRWIAERVDIDLSSLNVSRIEAIKQCMKLKSNTSGNPKGGRPPVDKVTFKCRLKPNIFEFLKVLADRAGINMSDYCALFIMKLYAAEHVHHALKTGKWTREMGPSDAQMMRFHFMREDGEVEEQSEFEALLKLEEEYMRRLEGLEDLYDDVAALQAEQLKRVDRIFRQTPPALKLKLKIELKCTTCSLARRFSEKPEEAREFLREHQCHETYLNEMTLDTYGFRIQRCAECGMITGTIDQPIVVRCEDHIREGRFAKAVQ